MIGEHRNTHAKACENQQGNAVQNAVGLTCIFLAASWALAPWITFVQSVEKPLVTILGLDLLMIALFFLVRAWLSSLVVLRVKLKIAACVSAIAIAPTLVVAIGRGEL